GCATSIRATRRGASSRSRRRRRTTYCRAARSANRVGLVATNSMRRGMQFQEVKMRIRTSALLLTACLLAICFTVSAQEDDALLDELFWEGETIFTTSCVACHDADGGSSSAPALSGLPSMGARDHIVRQILYGNAERGMP